jgi:hypothetical protein
LIPYHKESILLLSNFFERQKLRTKCINSNPEFAIIRNEACEHLQLGLFLLIRSGYRVSIQNSGYYKIYPKKKLLESTYLNPTTNAIFTLFCGYDDSISPSSMLQLSIALSLCVEDAFDWFLVCGFNLSSSTRKMRGYLHLLYLTLPTSSEKIYSSEESLRQIDIAQDWCDKNHFEIIRSKKLN